MKKLITIVLTLTLISCSTEEVNRTEETQTGFNRQIDPIGAYLKYENGITLNDTIMIAYRDSVRIKNEDLKRILGTDLIKEGYVTNDRAGTSIRLNNSDKVLSVTWVGGSEVWNINVSNGTYLYSQLAKRRF